MSTKAPVLDCLSYVIAKAHIHEINIKYFDEKFLNAISSIS